MLRLREQERGFLHQASGGDSEGDGEQRQEPTGLPLTTLQWVGRAAATLPPAFSAHPTVQKLCASRRCLDLGRDLGRCLGLYLQLTREPGEKPFI